MSGPWEKYKQQPAADGPWSRFGRSERKDAPQEELFSDAYYDRLDIPRGTEPDKVRSILQQRQGQSERDAASAGRKASVLGGIVKGADAYSRIANSALLGAPDYFMAKTEQLGAKLEGRDVPAFEDTRVKQMRAQTKKDDPLNTGIADISGALLGFNKAAAASALPSSAIKGQGLASTTAGAAADGALFGSALSVFNEGDVVKDARDNGLIGAGANILLRGAGNVAAPLFKGKKPKVPETPQVLNQAGALRKQIDDMGVEYSPEQVKQLYRGITDELPTTGLDAVEGKAADAIRRLSENLDRPVTMSQLDKLRQKASVNKATATPSEMREVGIIRNHIDDFMQGIDPATGGREAADLLKQSREMTRRGRSAERIEGLISKASDNAAGTVTGKLKTQDGVRRELKNFMNKKEFRFLKPDEQDAVKAVVQGNGIDTAARWAGKFQPDGGVSAGFGGTVALTTPMGWTVPAGGTLAKQIADARTRMATDALLRQIRAGSKQAAARPETKLSKSLQDQENQKALTRLLLAGSVAGSQN